MFSFQSVLDESAQEVCVELQSEACTAGEGDKLPWFEGSFEDLMASAGEKNAIVFIDFWATWCPPCRKMMRTTFRDERVVSLFEPQKKETTQPLLCYAVNVDKAVHQPLIEHYRVQPLPTLLFLNSDGTVRDRLVGYHAPDSFLKEVERIRRDENTLSGLRRKLDANPKDLEARLALATKLRKLGDEEGYREQVDAIRAIDPDQTSPVSRRLMRELRLSELNKLLKKAKQDFDLGPLYAFLKKESDPEFLFPGWYYAWTLEAELSKRAQDPVEKKKHRRSWVKAAHQLWEHLPEEELARYGNYVAWEFYVNRAELTKEDLAFALMVAEEAAAKAPEDPAVVDTLACCLFAVGKQKEALRFVRRCIELDPTNEEWHRRLKEFEGSE